MGQIKNWVKIQILQKVPLVILAKSHNTPADYARELFKPFKGSKACT